MIIILLLIIQNSNELDAAKAYLRGQELYSRGKYAEAIGEFRKALELDSTLTDVYEDLGWVLLDYGQVDTAEKVYEKIIKRYPKNAYYRYLYAWILINQGDYAAGMKEVNSAISLDAHFPDTYYARAYIYYYWKHDLDNAEKDLQKTLEIINNNFAVIKLLGNILHDRGECEKEKKLYRNSLKYESSSWFNLYDRGEIAMRIMDWQEALKTFEQLYKLNPNYYGVAFRLAECNVMTGNKERALSLYTEYLAMHPEDPSAYKSISILYNDMKLKEEAKEILLAASEQFPDSIIFKVLIGYVYSDQDPDSALMWINSSKGKRTNDLSSYDYLGLIYLRADSLIPAITNIRYYLKVDSTNGRCWGNLGIAYSRMRNSDSARICFEKALSYDSSYAFIYAGLGRTKLEAQEYNDAVKLFKKALSIDSLNAQAQAGLGTAYMKIGTAAQAMDCFKTTIIIDPTYWDAYSYLIFFYWQETDLTFLKSKLLPLAFKNKKTCQPYLLLAQVFYRESNDDSALIFATRALEIKPDIPELFILVSELHHNLKNTEKAIQYALDAYESKNGDSLIKAIACQGLYDLGEYDKARERLIKLEVDCPRLALPHYTMGLMHIRDNKYPEAVQELNKYLELKPDANDKKLVEEMIADLKKYIKN